MIVIMMMLLDNRLFLLDSVTAISLIENIIVCFLCSAGALWTFEQIDVDNIIGNCDIVRQLYSNLIDIN